jgi:hypothetical protein
MEWGKLIELADKSIKVCLTFFVGSLALLLWPTIVNNQQDHLPSPWDWVALVVALFSGLFLFFSLLDRIRKSFKGSSKKFAKWKRCRKKLSEMEENLLLFASRNPVGWVSLKHLGATTIERLEIILAAQELQARGLASYDAGIFSIYLKDGGQAVALKLLKDRQAAIQDQKK